MQLFSVSIREIQIDLIHYFQGLFPQDTAPIFPGTDVKKRYRYTPEAWAEVADELSTEQWMVHLGVVLIQDDMRFVSTIAQLASLISNHIHHVVAPQARVEVTPLTTLMRSSKPVLASIETPKKPTKRAKAAARKAKKRKSGRS
ncbi:hypothetical protein [Bradyrhizobium sp. ORS 86]|uniref:hypothetical protein n=1 Tax=Bradyrhizobium sp. ORS 86 TaxID=1685970 RepID=UPI00388ED7A5